VTLNRAIDLSRKRQAGADSMTTMMKLPAADVAAVEPMDCATLRQDIAAALDRLTDIQRGVLVAKVYDEMTFAEIAAEMSLANSTVKTHYLRAVQAVRDRLRPKWADEVQ